jgi:hypothetical protein
LLKDRVKPRKSVSKWSIGGPSECIRASSQPQLSSEEYSKDNEKIFIYCGEGKEHHLLEGSQVSPACPAKNRAKKKMLE